MWYDLGMGHGAAIAPSMNLWGRQGKIRENKWMNEWKWNNNNNKYSEDEAMKKKNWSTKRKLKTFTAYYDKLQQCYSVALIHNNNDNNNK